MGNVCELFLVINLCFTSISQPEPSQLLPETRRVTGTASPKRSGSATQRQAFIETQTLMKWAYCSN
jgi:hypothetical protein